MPALAKPPPETVEPSKDATVVAFRAQASGAVTVNEARFYLEEHAYDLKAALVAQKEDADWENMERLKRASDQDKAGGVGVMPDRKLDYLDKDVKCRGGVGGRGKEKGIACCIS